MLKKQERTFVSLLFLYFIFLFFYIWNIRACLISLFWLFYQNSQLSKTQKGEKMSEKEITLRFDLDDERENRIYFALKKIPNFLNEPMHSF